MKRLSDSIKLHNRLVGLTRRSLGLLALGGLAFTLQANEITDNLTVTGGGSVVPIGDDEALVTFTSSGTVRLNVGTAKARILAVGGGGGGGGSPNTLKMHGGGGGGGAGGFVEVDEVPFVGKYDIAVGQGGAGVAAKTKADGTDGGDTTITQNGIQVEGVAVAKGGGGGGSESEGHAGGSGGGGSLLYEKSTVGWAKAGGSGEPLQGNKGGAALTDNVSYGIGGGGGGAGGPGTDVTANDQAGGAPGGIGRRSTIQEGAVAEDGDNWWFAGGGAGGDARSAKTGAAPGGKGGGGNSGDGGSYTAAGARDGRNGTGGGGGGGSVAVASGRGGDGIVIIRISQFESGVPVPDMVDFVWDGTPKTVCEPSKYYELDGDITKTEAGEYRLVMTLTPEGEALGWKDGFEGKSRTVDWSIARRKVDPPARTAESFAYDGTEKTGWTESAYYTFSSEGSAVNRATDAGTYRPTVTLKDADNCTWSALPGDLTWTIGSQKVDETLIVPKTTLVYNGSEQTAYQPTAQQLVQFTLEGNRATTAGPHTMTATLNNPAGVRNYVWSDDSADPKYIAWSIAKADNEIYGLTLKDWQIGQASDYPKCSGVKFRTGMSLGVTYAWGLDPDGEVWMPWGDVRDAPTEAGVYYVRASTAETVNWHAASVTQRFSVWANPADVFTDFVDITLSGYTPTTRPANVDIEIGSARESGGVVTGGLPGFEFARAGAEGRELRFVLTNEVRELDQLLPFAVSSWDVSGKAKLRVRLPYLKGEATTIQMYWHAADGDPKSVNRPEDVIGASVASTAAFSLVNRERSWVDYWTDAPTMTKTRWEYSAPPTEADVTNGELKTGVPVVRYVLTLPGGETNTTIQTEAGSYKIVFTRPAMTGGQAYSLYGGERSITYEIVRHSPYEDIGGSAGGRILLGNNDTMAGNEIDGQAYWQTIPPESGTWWVHEDTLKSPTLLPNLDVGVYHTLWGRAAGRSSVLWRVRNGRLGSLYPSNGSAASARNYLPWSPTSQPRSPSSATISSKETTCIVLRNVGGNLYEATSSDDDCPAVYSPCYSNGIGTIYFDAVNGWTADKNARLVLEIATATSKGEPPTDENCGDPGAPGDPYYYLSHNAKGETLSEADDMWVAVKPTMLRKRKGQTEFTDAGETVSANGYLPLTVDTESGKDNDFDFYRILFTTNHAGPVRFRIRRPVKSGTAAIDTSNLILVDNIIVSPPTMGANLTAPGKSDAESGRTGKQTLGQACALDTAFPAATDTGVRGRARISYQVVPGMEVEKGKFVASAKFKYRWRYLNQRIEPPEQNGAPVWRELYLDHSKLKGEDGEILTTVEPIDFTGRAGDIEWCYEMTLQAPYYQYVDYSGCGAAKPTGDFSEERREVLDAQNSAVRQASLGTDWFVRLRDGHSAWEGMKVQVAAVDASAQPIEGVYPMEIVGDNMWRALVVVPTNATGRCSFRFEGVNEHAASPDEVSREGVVFGVSAGDFTGTIPGMGSLVEDGHAVTVMLDNPQIAGYLEFRLSDRYLTYQVSRAEYQDFNNWTDAHTVPTSGDNAKFLADSQDTNSVNVAEMKTESAKITTWEPFVATDDNWNEPFSQNDYAPTPGDRFDKEVFHVTHETPHGWTAQNVTFVSENLVSKEDQKTKSGMAAKLQGGGKGLMDFANMTNSPPEGLEKVTLSARIGQSYTPDSFAYALRAIDDGYLFFAPVTMSHHTNDDDDKPSEMAVGASASLIGYYIDGYGCYEFRAERLYNGKKLRLSVYKWYISNFQWSNECLCSRDFDNVRLWSEEYDSKTVTWTAERDRAFYGMFIAFKTDFADASGDRVQPRKTRIICGLSDAHATDHNRSWEPFNNPAAGGGNAPYVGLVCEDEDEPFGFGCYGVTAKDCPAQFVMPAHRWLDDVTRGAPQDDIFYEKFDAVEKKDVKDGDRGRGRGQYFENATLHLGDNDTFEHDRDKLTSRRYWATIPGRCEAFVNEATGFSNWIGLRTPTNLVQQLELYLKPKGTDESNWRLYGSKSVRGYGFRPVDPYVLKTPGTWDLRLKTGTNAVDVVVDDICQYRWQAPDINDPGKITSDDRSGIFVFSQGIVTTNRAAKAGEIAQWFDLQPARADVARPVSLRSPIMKGLGKFTFDYRNADANAEVWVQVATNNVSDNLTGAGGYNDSLKSVELGEPSAVGEWITVAKYSTTAKGDLKLARQGTTDTKTVYIGWHDHPGKPLKGLFRLVVPQTTVSNAIERAKGGIDDYGRISITACTCTDEPGMSDRSWYAWNMRTIGDSTDAEGRMNFVDMVIAGGGQGLVAALNNSTKDVVDKEGRPGDPEKLQAWAPAIYSPTMRSTGDAGIGSVAVKARLYYGEAKTAGAGQIVVWGAKDSRATDWTPLCTNYVTEAVFSNFLWVAGHDVYKAVKFEVSDPSARTSKGQVDRVLLDEIVIGEKVPPTIGFAYARPFRMDLFSKEPIADIMSPNEQPLAGESWGVQTQLTLQQLTDEIDIDKGFEVRLSYYKGLSPWGYRQWRDLPGAVKDIRLEPVGDATNLVFRSVGDRPESLVDPSMAGGEVVQFMLTVKYWDRGGKGDEVRLSTDWRQPDWFYPLDYNAKNGGDRDPDWFSAYTVLDTVSPGRAWINEVSWNDGPSAENGGVDMVTHQYIELCVPAGVDLTEWYLQTTDPTLQKQVIARLGDVVNGIPSSKGATVNSTNGYEFLVLQSPATRDAGGIRHPGTSVSAADGTWYKVDCGRYAKEGTFYYGEAYQFELVRPSGIIEHQFVMGGTNELSSWSWGAVNDATNLVNSLNVADLTEFPNCQSPKRFYAGDDVSRTEDGRDYASTGVVGGEDGADTTMWPGGSGTWRQAMPFTPGRINKGQTIPKDWFSPANGTNSWVYFIADGEHVRQDFGGDTNRSILVVMPQGRTTNIVYTVDNWCELAVRENDVPTVAGRTGRYVHTISPTGTYYVVATDVPQRRLSEEFGLTDDNPYSPAVRSWLRERYGDYSADDVRLARYKGLGEGDEAHWMTLTDMYWLDIPPVPQSKEEWATNDGTNWWLRGGVLSMGADHVIARQVAGQTVLYTNKQIGVTLYVSNACPAAPCAPYAPTHLQGLGNEQSDEMTAGAWTSVTFKVYGKLELDAAKKFLPFRIFTFDGDSFTGADDPHPFTATIDIFDPFQSPIGRNYEWDKYPNTKAYFTWRINADYYPYTTERLKADSTYPDHE